MIDSLLDFQTKVLDPTPMAKSENIALWILSERHFVFNVKVQQKHYGNVQVST